MSDTTTLTADVGAAPSAQCDERFAEVQEFATEHGQARLPHGYELGPWVELHDDLTLALHDMAVVRARLT